MGFVDTYFEKYGGESEDYLKSHENTCFNVTNLIEAVNAAIEETYPDSVEDWYVNSFLDVGAATGLIAKQFLTICPSVLGVEFSEWPKTRVEPFMASRMLWGDWLSVSPFLGSNSFDLVLDCASLYVPKAQLDQAIKQVFRITNKISITIVETENDPDRKDYGCDHMNLDLNLDWWTAKMAEVGYSKVYSTYVSSEDTISEYYDLLIAFKSH